MFPWPKSPELSTCSLCKGDVSGGDKSKKGVKRKKISEESGETAKRRSARVRNTKCKKEEKVDFQELLLKFLPSRCGAVGLSRGGPQPPASLPPLVLGPPSPVGASSANPGLGPPNVLKAGSGTRVSSELGLPAHASRLGLPLSGADAGTARGRGPCSGRCPLGFSGLRRVPGA